MAVRGTAGDEENHEAILAFRGTELRHPKDLLTDIKARKIRAKSIGGRVHQGFWESMKRVERDVRDAIRDESSPRVYATGHSKGAAEAVLFHVSCFYSSEAIVFGCPRVGDAEFRDWIEIRGGNVSVTRYQNNNDIVCHLPPAVPGWVWKLRHPWLPRLPGGYRHVGKLRYIDHCGKIHDETSRRFRLKDSVMGAIDDIGKWGLDCFKDHGMWKHYVGALQREEKLGGVRDAF